MIKFIKQFGMHSIEEKILIKIWSILRFKLEMIKSIIHYLRIKPSIMELAILNIKGQIYPTLLNNLLLLKLIEIFLIKKRCFKYSNNYQKTKPNRIKTTKLELLKQEKALMKMQWI